MNRLGARYASLLRLPACVGNREADAAGPVASGPRVLFGEEEDTVGDIAAPSDGAQRGGAVETAVDATAAAATQHPWLSAGVRFAVGTDKYPGLAHSSTTVPGHNSTFPTVSLLALSKRYMVIPSSLLRIMENDSDRMTMPGTDAADPMPQIDSIDFARPPAPG